MENFLTELRTRVWRTSGARYNAARRLRLRDWFATFSIAMFSAIGIALAVVQKVYAFDANSPVDRYITVLSVAIGLFVIVISLIEWGFSAAVKADVLHRNAEQLNRLQLEIAQTLASESKHDSDAATIMRKRYEEIKDSCSFNHEPIDDALFRSQNRLSPEFSDKVDNPSMCLITAKWTQLKAFCSAAKVFVVFWVIIVTMLFVTPWPIGA
jgi:SMODS and SLOG-associating 2TM effector domain family 5